MLAEVLSIDAWHDPFRIDGVTSAVYVEVSFQQGRLGGDDPKIPFSFKIGLKRALLTVRLESPLTIKRSSIARDIPVSPIELQKILSAKDVAKQNWTAKGDVNIAKFSAALSGQASSDQELTREEQLKVVQQVPRITATARPRGSNEYAWDLQPTFEPILEGQPWHPVDAPRMHVRHPNAGSKLDPVIKVTLSCALEDISITELELKPASLIDTVIQTLRNEHSYAAAVQYLKRVLTEADIEVSNIDSRLSDIWLADVLAQREELDHER